MKKKTLVIGMMIAVVVLMLGVALLPHPTNAGIIDNIRDKAETFNSDSTQLPGGGEDPVKLVGKVVSYVLGFLGIIFLILVIWGGVQWMVSAGDPKKVESARKRIIAAAAGIAVIVLALAIVQFVLQILEQTTL